MTTKMFKPDFNRHPLNDDEAALELLEASWVDFLYGVRLRNRYIRAENRVGMRGFGLNKVHRILENYKQQAAEGDSIATWRALIYCAQENVPLPYWLGDAILQIEKKLNKEPSNLHEMFGFKSRLPEQGKRAHTSRRDVQLQQRLWNEVSVIMRDQGISLDAAISQAIQQLKFPYSQRKSRQMFDDQERIQNARADAVDKVKRHYAPK